MKQIISTIKVLLLVVIMSTTFSSCEDFMSTASSRLTLADDNLIDSANDSVYSILGILNQVQKISDRYVLIGELRADLMDVTSLSESELRDLSEFKVNASTSQFSDVKDFYAVINNCNLFIQRADTNIVVRTNKPFVKELAVAKSIRAWTYMQLVLNYGKAYYFKKPILTVQDSKESFPELGPEEMIDSLIADMNSIQPLSLTKYPNYGSINEVQSKYLFISPKFLMGDLYLWKSSYTKNAADYEQAATYYAKLIEEASYINHAGIGVKWYNDFFLTYTDNWIDYLTLTSNGELISISKLASNNYEGTTSKVALLCAENKLSASQPMYDLFANQSYCFYDAVTSSAKYYPGDLRIKSALKSTIDEKTYITKFKNYNINFYRTALLYLRFAEAINRAGKPGASFAVLKYGLSAATLRDNKKVSASELSDSKEYLTIFTKGIFDANVGLHNRGCGNTTYNTGFVIPDYTRFSNQVVTDANGIPLIGIDGNDSIALLPTKDPALLALAKSDSITFVENAICDELALETGLEGNRFLDLMRFSNHKNDTEFLSAKVAAKHSDYNTYFIKLKDKNNWYIPVKP